MAEQLTPDASEMGWKRILSSSTATTLITQALLTLSGVLSLLTEQWRQHPALLAISIAVLTAGVLWFVVGRYLQWRRPKQPLPDTDDKKTVSGYLRGLLPFEKGERLLGRDMEKNQLMVILRSMEFSIGFLSGEAGAGKTSLLRALILPLLEADNRNPLYVPRASGEPEAAIKKALLSSTLLGPFTDKESTLIDLLKTAQSNAAPRSIVIIIDQFEEFFISNRTKETRASFENMLGDAIRADLNVKFLLALRKEFVDDLLDMGGTIPALRSTRWRLPLRNISSLTAREMLKKIVKDERLLFSEQLQGILIADLARDETVRLVEFQLVLTSLLSQAIFDVESYADTQGAQGVIARFVTEIIEPPEKKNSEAETWVARRMFRALCNDEFTSRRPVGLTRDEIMERIQAEAHHNEQAPFSAAELESSLNSIIKRAHDSCVIIQEDEHRYNLTHDYLAAPVRDATAGVESIEERANRVLERYIENANMDSVILPWKTLRFVRRFATPEILARHEASILIKRSRRQHAFVGVSAALVTITIPAFLLPFGEHYRVLESVSLKGEIVISKNGATLAALDNKKLSIYNLTSSTLKPVSKTLDFEIFRYIISPNGNRLLLSGKDKSIHQVQIDGDFSIKIKKLFDGIGNWSPRTPFGFSEQGNWAYSIAEDGRVYAWPENNSPVEVKKIRYLSNQFSRLVDLSKITKEVLNKDGELVIHTPVSGISNAGWLWIVDGENNLHLINTMTKANAPATEILKVSQGFMSSAEVIVSPLGSRLAVFDTSPEIRFINLKQQDNSSPVTTIQVKPSDRERGFARIAFSPNEKWLIFRHSFQNFFAINLQQKNTAAIFPAIEIARSSSDGFSPIRFDPSESYATGLAQDKKFYLWKLDSPPGASAKPINDSRNKEDTNAAFCPDGKHVLVASEDGSLHNINFKAAAPKAQLMGSLAAGNAVFYELKDKATILVHDGSRLASTQCDNDLRIIHDQMSSIVDVVDDTRGNLIVVSDEQANRIGRAFYLFGLPVWQMPIAGIQRESIARARY